MLGALKLWNKCSINHKSNLMWGHANSHYALNKTRASAVWVLLLTSSLGRIFHKCNRGWTGSKCMPDISCLSCRITSFWRACSDCAWSDMLLYWPFAMGGPMKNYDDHLQWLWAQNTWWIHSSSLFASECHTKARHLSLLKQKVLRAHFTEMCH